MCQPDTPVHNTSSFPTETCIYTGSKSYVKTNVFKLSNFLLNFGFLGLHFPCDVQKLKKVVLLKFSELEKKSKHN